MKQAEVVCTIDDIPEERTKVIEFRGRQVQLIRLENEIYALDNICTHEALPMGECRVHNGEIQCPRHGAKFDAKTGKATGLPAVMPLKTYQVNIDDGKVLIIAE